MNLVKYWPKPSGGGAVFLYAHNITINGGIKVNGVDGGIPTIINVGYCVGLGGGGGGSGGSLQISACNLSFDTVNSEVQANGGNGGKSYGFGKISMLLSLIMLLYALTQTPSDKNRTRIWWWWWRGRHCENQCC